MNESHTKLINELESLNANIKEIRCTQQCMEKKIQIISQNIFREHSHSPKSRANSQGKRNQPEQPSHQQQSNEDLWLSLSSLTCSPADISHDEALHPTQSDSCMPSQHLNHEPRTPMGANLKRKYTVIYEDRTTLGVSQHSKGSRVVDEGSDSDGDYCSWRSRGEE
jgi:hypothetical protein